MSYELSPYTACHFTQHLTCLREEEEQRRGDRERGGREGGEREGGREGRREGGGERNETEKGGRKERER